MRISQKLPAIGFLATSMILFGCLSAPNDTGVGDEGAGETVVANAPTDPLTTAPQGGAAPTARPIVPEQQLIFSTYEHPTNVFRLSVPDSWAMRDDSSDERILLTLEPPLGFASRIVVDVTFEGDLTFEEMDALANGYLALFYGSNLAYTEISRATLPDGRLQVTELYNHSSGVSGRETAYLQQAGPYFAALRVFVSDAELVAMAGPVERIVESLTLNPTARWGAPPLAVNLEDLEMQNVHSWSDSDGNFWVMGLVFNNWIDDVEFITVSTGVCDPSGVVLSEGSNVLVNDMIPRGLVAPFAIKFGPVSAGIVPRPCLLQVTAEPPGRLSEDSYTRFDVTHSAALNQADEVPILSISGVVQNVGPETASLIDVVIAVYDAPDGDVIGYAVTSPEASQLAAGDASFFNHDFDVADLGAGLETSANWVYELWVQGNPLPTTPDS